MSVRTHKATTASVTCSRVTRTDGCMHSLRGVLDEFLERGEVLFNLDFEGFTLLRGPRCHVLAVLVEVRRDVVEERLRNIAVAAVECREVLLEQMHLGCRGKRLLGFFQSLLDLGRKGYGGRVC